MRIMGAERLFNPKKGIIRGWLGLKPFIMIYKHKLAEVNHWWMDVKGNLIVFCVPFNGNFLLLSPCINEPPAFNLVQVVRLALQCQSLSPSSHHHISK